MTFDLCSAYTIRTCREQEKPLLVLSVKSLMNNPEAARLHLFSWLVENEISVLNVAGNRESITPGIQAAVRDLVRRVAREVVARNGV